MVMDTTSRRGIRSALLATAVLAPLLLSGCSVAVTDPATGTSPAPGSSAPSDAGSPAPEETGGTEPGDQPSVVVDDETRARLDRDRLREQVTQNLTCVDGSATVGRDLDGMIVELTGDCAEVTIEASAGGVLLPAVGVVTIVGDGATVVMASADEIVFDDAADINVVGWESGTPVIRYAGVSNVTTPVS